MFKKKIDDENGEDQYSFSTRFWVQAVILGMLIILIGFSTQRTANKTEELNREALAYGQQTNDCLSQTLGALRNVRKVNDDISKLNDRRDEVTNNLIVGLASIPADLPPEEVQKQTGDVIEKYLRDRKDITDESNELLRQRADAQTQYPEPNCGDKLPGE